MITCDSGLARLLCGDVAWWEALLICSGALLLGFLLVYVPLKLTGRWRRELRSLPEPTAMRPSDRLRPGQCLNDRRLRVRLARSAQNYDQLWNDPHLGPAPF